jgi:type I restriction enzyme S subunit
MGGEARREPVPPGYKMTEVGVIPEDWGVRKVADLARFRSGDSISLVSYSDRPNDGTIPVFGGNGHSGFADRDNASDPTIVIGRVGQKCGVVYQTTGPVWITDNALYAYQLSASVLLEFFSRALESYRLNDDRNRNDLPLITQGILGAVPIPVPPLPEQRAIAEALSDVDSLLDALDRLIAKKRAVKQAAMQQLITGKTRLPGFAGEWGPHQLGTIARIQVGRTPSRSNQKYWGDGFVWLSIADMVDRWLTESSEEITYLATLQMQPVLSGTLLMSFKLSLGRLGIAGCDLYTNEAICALMDLECARDFLFYALQQVDFSRYGKLAVKGYTLNQESLQEIEVLLPPLPEQRAIAKVLSDIDDEIAALEKRRDKTRRIKEGMMQQLLTGRVRLLKSGEKEWERN